MDKIPGHSQPTEYPSKAGESPAGASTPIIQAVITGLKSRQFYKLYIMALLLVYGAIFYYFEEIARLLCLQPQYIGLFSEIRESARLYFLVPVVYAGLVFGARLAIIAAFVSGAIFLPHDFFIPPVAIDPFEPAFFIPVSGAVGCIASLFRRWFRKNRPA